MAQALVPRDSDPHLHTTNGFGLDPAPLARLWITVGDPDFFIPCPARNDVSQAQKDIPLKVWKELAISKQILMRMATDVLKLDPECTQDELKEALEGARHDKAAAGTLRSHRGCISAPVQNALDELEIAPRQRFEDRNAREEEKSADVVIPVNAKQAYIDVNPLYDGLGNEELENVTLTLASGNYSPGSSTEGTVTINDSASPTSTRTCCPSYGCENLRFTTNGYIMTEEMAQKYFGDGDPIGREITIEIIFPIPAVGPAGGALFG